MSKYKQIDLNNIKTYTSAQRKSKVETSLEARPPFKGMTMKDFLERLPNVLKADNLKAIAKAVVDARKAEKPVIVMLGGHVIKTGCSPILIDLAQKGLISHFASNGSVAIHDTELALFGHTSEDVDEALTNGTFGMAADLADFINNASATAVMQDEGFGEALGRLLLKANAPFPEQSLLAQSYKLEIPYTLHIALGTDIVHQHPSADGSAIGETSLRDFKILARTVSKIGDGGVVLNFGSAVMLPEVFLKCLSVARNLGHNVKNFTTANFDMIQHYRPSENVVRRPVIPGGKGYAITGHHEIMIPLLAAAIYEYE